MVIWFFEKLGTEGQRGAVGGQQSHMAKSRTRHGARTVHVPVRLAHHHGRRSRDLAAIPRGVVHAGQPAVDPRRARGIPPRRVRNTSQPHKSDRKSTRLNSSHLEISYAVFSLKKKKK